MPKLVRLEFQAQNSWNFDQYRSRAESSVFPRLQLMRLGTNEDRDLTACTAVLTAFPPPHVEVLLVSEGTNIQSPRDLRAFCVLLSNLEFYSLRAVTCHIGLAGFDFLDAVRFSDLAPLLAIQSLRCVEIEFHYGSMTSDDNHYDKVVFYDEVFVPVAKSWPTLQTFQLLVDTGAPGEDRNVLPTMKALAILARHPEILHMGLTFDTSVAVPPPDLSNRLVHALQVDGSKLEIDDIPETAAYLSRLFPRVESVSLTTYRELDYQEMWEEFNDRYDELRMDVSFAEEEESDETEGTEPVTEEGSTEEEDLEDDGDAEDHDDDGDDVPFSS